MRGIDHQDIDAGFHEAFHAFVRVSSGTDRGADPKCGPDILARAWKVTRLLKVLGGDHAA